MVTPSPCESASAPTDAFRDPRSRAQAAVVRALRDEIRRCSDAGDVAALSEQLAYELAKLALMT